MNRKSRIIVSVVGIVVVLLALLGLTYAYYLTRIQGNTNTNSISVTTENLRLVYGDGTTSILASATPIEPGKFSSSKDFTVTNSGNALTDYAVTLEDFSITYANDTVIDGVSITAGTVTKMEYPSDLKMTITCVIESDDEDRNGQACGTVDGTLPTENSILLTNSIEVDDIHKYVLTLTYVDSGIDQSADMNKTIKGKLDIIDPKSTIDLEGSVASYQTGDYVEINSTPIKSEIVDGNYKLIGVEPGSHTLYVKYIDIDGNIQTRGSQTLTIKKGDEASVSGRIITFTEDYRIARVNFTENYEIKVEEFSNDISLVYNELHLTQSVTASDDYLFVPYLSLSNSANGNEYKIRKIDRHTYQTIETSNDTFSHCNGLTYNENTNELIVASAYDEVNYPVGVTDSQKSVIIVEPATLTIKEIIDLNNIVDSVDANNNVTNNKLMSITYDELNKEYYMLTKASIIVTDEEFNLKKSMYVDKIIGKSYVGSLLYKDGLIYIPSWENTTNYILNEIYIYDKNGNYIETKTINGSPHIQGIDFINNKFYISFWNPDSYYATVYSMDHISDLNNLYYVTGGKNYFDYNYYFDNIFDNKNEDLQGTILYLEPNTTYTISTNIPYTKDGTLANVFVDNTSNSTISTTNHGFGLNKSKIVTTGTNGILYIVTRRTNPQETFIVIENDFINGTYWIQIEKGTETTEYEPYIKVGSQ